MKEAMDMVAQDVSECDTIVLQYFKVLQDKLAASRKDFYLATFFQYNKRLLRQKTGGACLYMPQKPECWTLAS